MRIISGKLKGKSINFVKNLNTRPLKDSVKENIFNIIKHSNLIDIRLEKSKILDLYSGIGSFGIECISRGAREVSFVEQDRNAAKILEDNLIKLSIQKKVNIFFNSVEDMLEKNKKKKFNIFFFDPPFSDKKYMENLGFIKNNKMYEKKHILIIHREKNTRDNFENKISIIREKNYGRSNIIFGVFK